MASAPITRQVVWIVRCLVGDIGEEGFAVATVGVDEFDQLVGVSLGGIVAVGKTRQICPSSVKTDFGDAAVKFVMSQ